MTTSEMNEVISRKLDEEKMGTANVSCSLLYKNIQK